MSGFFCSALCLRDSATWSCIAVALFHYYMVFQSVTVPQSIHSTVGHLICGWFPRLATISNAAVKSLCMCFGGHVAQTPFLKV